MRWLVTAIGVLLTVGAALQFPRDRILHGQNDFLSLYCGSKLSGTGELRSAEAHKKIAQGEAGIWMPSVLFTRPDYYAILLRPLRWLPFRTSYWAFQVLSLCALALFLWIFRRKENLALLALCSIPLVTVFANGQDVTFLILAFCGAVLLEKQGKSFAAGLLLSFCTVKFHLFVFVPLALLAYRKGRMILGAVAGTAAGVAAAMFVEGPGWIARYAHFLSSPDLHPLPFPLNFRAVAGMFGLGEAGELAMGLGVAALLIWFAWQRLPFGTLISLSLLGGLLVSRHLGLHDYALVLACCALSEGTLKQGFFWLATPPVYISMLLPDPWSALGVAAACTVLALPLWLTGKPASRCVHALPGDSVPHLTKTS